MFYLTLFLFTFLEPFIWIGYLFPGTLLLVFAWAWVSQAIFNFWIVFFIAILWNLFGSTINYFLWLKTWKKALKKWFWFIKPAYFKRWVEFIEKYKGRFLLFWKQIPWLKEIITFLAGVFHVRFKKFMFWNTIWALIWFFVNFLIWYIFWYSSSSMIKWKDKSNALILYFFVLVVLFMLLRFFLVEFWKKIYWFIKQFLKWLIWFLPSPIQKMLLSFSLSSVVVLLIIFSLVYLFFAYIWFAKAWYSNPLIGHIDIAMSNLMAYYYNPTFEKIALFFSFWGNLSTIVILFLLWILFLKKGDKIWFVRWSLGVIFVFLIVFFTKLIVARHRPELSLYTELSYSFPSFHASISLFFYGLLALFFASKQKYWNEKVNIVVVFLFFVLLIWLSRIYLNVHYFSDVLGGYWIGFVILMLVMMIRKINFLQDKLFTLHKKLNLSKSGKIFLAIFLVGILFLTFFRYFQNFNYVSNLSTWLTQIQSLTGYFDSHNDLKYTTTVFWRQTEPINFIFLVKDKSELVKLFLKAGFEPADDLTPKTLKKLILAAYDGKNYKTAPMLPIFWNGKTQIFGFQKQDGELAFRHHIRIWDTGLMWKNYHIFVGCAVYDDGIKWKVTHKIAPDIDKEREYFFKELLSTGEIWKYKKIQWVSPIENWKNFSYDNFFTDGKAYILWVK